MAVAKQGRARFPVRRADADGGQVPRKFELPEPCALNLRVRRVFSRAVRYAGPGRRRVRAPRG
eukprot:11060895-Lingulodinium_polyedra.AAC.1